MDRDAKIKHFIKVHKEKGMSAMLKEIKKYDQEVAHGKD